MNYPHPFMMGQIPISQQMAMMAQQQQQQQHQQMLQQQQQHHQAPMPPQQAPMPPQQPQQQPPPQQQASHVTHASPAAAKVQKKRRRKDPNSPKRAMSAYFMFVQKERQEMEKRGEKISKVTEFTKAVSEKWRRMSPAEREPYERLSEKDKERYEAEMVAFTGKKKDVNKPKKPQTAYFLWLAGWREHNKDKFDHKELLRQAGLVWNRLNDVEKAPYLRAAEEEKQKYEARMREYTSGLAVNKPAGGGASNVKQAKIDTSSNQQQQVPSHMAGGQQQGQGVPLPGMQMTQGSAMGSMSPQAMAGGAQQGGNVNMMNYAAAQQAAMAQQFHQMATAYYQQQQQQQQRLQLQQPGNGNHDNGDDDDDDDDEDDDEDDDGDGSE